MRTTTLFAFAITAAASAIANQGQACESDAQCKGDRVCTNGACVAPPARAAQGAPPAGATPVATTPAQAGAPGATPPHAGTAPPGAPAGWPPGTYSPPPAGAPPAEPKTRRRVGLLVTGSVLGGLGFIGMIMGGAAFAAGLDAAAACNSAFNPNPGEECDSQEGTRDAGSAIMIGSGIALAAAIPLIIVGARKVPVERDEALRGDATVAIKLGRGGIGVVGTF
jgi:hypothetical protein